MIASGPPIQDFFATMQATKIGMVKEAIKAAILAAIKDLSRNREEELGMTSLIAKCLIEVGETVPYPVCNAS